MLDERDVFEARVRERAFRLWQEAGCPEDSAEEFWDRARAVELNELNLTPQQLEEKEKEKSSVSEAADFA
jgi:Protein of unknown function (DUF2934)